MAQIQMYPASVNSISTTLNGGITNVATSITVTDGSKLPTAPCLLTIGSEEDAETILMTIKNTNTLTVTRGVEGTVKAWDSGEIIARTFTAYDHDAFKDNIEDLDSRLNSINGITVSANPPETPLENRLWLDTSESGPVITESSRGICFSINNIDLATTQTIAIIAPFSLEIKGGKMGVGTAHTGAALICDVHKNGTTIWTTQDNRPIIADGDTSATIILPDVVSVAQGDRLLLMVDQIGSTVAGKDLSLTLYCEVV